MDEILKQLLQEEQELQFAKFNEDIAWELGSQLVERRSQLESACHDRYYTRQPSAFPRQPAWDICR
jgi:hypothetical protein